MFIDALRPESTSGRICEAAFPVGLTNSAGRGARIYKHATPVGAGNVAGSLLFYLN